MTMIRVGLFFFVLNFIHSDSFRFRLNRRQSTYVSSQPNSYDFDMVRPAVEFNLAEVVPVDIFLKDYDLGAKIQGVYAVQDTAGTVLYVGSSMSMPVDIERLSKKLGNDIVNSLRIQTFPNPKPDAIEAYKLELIRQLSPSGNIDNFDMWEDKPVIRNSAVQSTIVNDIPSSSVDDRSVSRTRLMDAVSSDNIKSDTNAIESPFKEDESDAYVIGPNSSAGIEFTKENVDKVLDEVRPYLIADGGNVEVVSVDEFTRSVSLSLQGACGSCPSSTVSSANFYLNPF